MATVKMIKGNKYADIFDSPETIAQAEKDGFIRVKSEPVQKHVEVQTEEESTDAEEKTVKRGRTPRQ